MQVLTNTRPCSTNKYKKYYNYQIKKAENKEDNEYNK